MDTAVLNRIWEKVVGWGETLVVMLPNLAVATVVIVLAWFFSRLVANGICRLIRRFSNHESLIELVRKLIRVIVLGIGFVVALQILELDKAATTFLAGAGIIGLALGFAFQDLSANFISGVFLAARRPMQIGDIVETNDYIGVVQAIELRSSLIRTFQGQMVMMPNRKIFEEPLVNYSQLGRRRVDLPVGVSYGDDLPRAAEIAVEAVRSEVGGAEQVEAFYEAFGDSSINFQLRFWVSFRRQPDYLEARSKAIMAIKAAFDANDVTIPFPIRTLDFSAVGGEQLDAQLSTITNDARLAPAASAQSSERSRS